MKNQKPTLVQVGKSFVDPNDIAAIVKVSSKKKLYVIRLKSQPNPEYPFWAEEKEIELLMGSFNIICSDDK